MAYIDPELENNYEQIVNDPNSGVTYKSLVESATANGSPDLAAWARERAAKSGKDITPKAAKPAARESRSDEK